MEHWRLLLQKDFLLWRNSYWRTRAQVAGTLAVAAILTVIAGLVIRALLRWFLPIAETFRGGVTVEMLSPLVLMLLIWLLASAFFATAQLSREQFFLMPDLALLIATPVRPRVIFTLRVAFLALAPLSIVDMVIFGLSPLFALGLMAAAPWYYYALLLPLLYFYRIIPVVSAVVFFMLLARVLPPRRLYQALAAGNLVLGTVPAIFYFGDRQALLLRWATRLGGVERELLAPVAAMHDVVLGLMGAGVGVWRPLLILVGSVAACMALAAAVVERLYFRNYERLQNAERLPAKRVLAHRETSHLGQRPLLWFLVVEHWKTAMRNREMLPASVGLMAMLFAYVITVGRFVGGLPWVMLLNVMVVAICAQATTSVLLVPFAAATNPDLLLRHRQHWFYKVSPVRERTFALSLFLAHILPALVLALVLMVPVNHFTGFAGGETLMTAGLLTLLLVSSVALGNLTQVIDAVSGGGRVPLLGRVARAASHVYGVLFMLPPALALHYRQVGLLSFVHGVPPAVVAVLAALITTTVATVVTLGSLRRLVTAWQLMEIK